MVFSAWGRGRGCAYHDNDLCVWPCFVHAGHELDVAVVEGRTGDVVHGAVVVCAQVNDD